MTKVKEIVLVLENCEYIKIPTKYLANIIIEDIDISVRRNAINSIDKLQTANSIYLDIIKPETIKTLGLFDEDDEESLSCSKRLIQHADITSVEVAYDDNSKEEYFVDWDWNNEYLNSYQDTKLAKNGNLQVLINRKKSLKEFLDDENFEVSYDYIMNEKENNEWGFWE
ncbi:hypothetical protein P3U41_05915 [Mammaliicoccus sciuri]|uniref:hypothetical protein n=1 Tax=Mammaliicoccus sciuri TaxID=1296 RepID=UPI002B258DE1|nr:hypothetical protein [Mammaliicoccus sciuri]WQL34306.1 hypothetical protein P3U41_05915 [Mammaliicoccus sciuri]WQL61245.1 hypothetical protein P3T96_05915 [Mammaliicoccus sciuri]